MRITERKLRKIIREEAKSLMTESSQRLPNIEQFRKDMRGRVYGYAFTEENPMGFNEEEYETTTHYKIRNRGLTGKCNELMEGHGVGFGDEHEYDVRVKGEDLARLDVYPDPQGLEIGAYNEFDGYSVPYSMESLIRDFGYEGTINRIEKLIGSDKWKREMYRNPIDVGKVTVVGNVPPSIIEIKSYR